MLVIFDCDGVLVDSEILSARVFSECLAEKFNIDVSPSYSLESYRGKSVADCIQMIADELNIWLGKGELSDEACYDRGFAFWRHVQLQTLVACESRLDPVEGIPELLEFLRAEQIAFCVASNGKHEKMQVTLAKTGLMPFVEGKIFSFEDVARGKPAPDLFLHAAKSMGFAAEQAVVIEDSLTGVVAANAAGMKAFAYCPDNEDGSANGLVAEFQALGAQPFKSMLELKALLPQLSSAKK